MDDLIKKDDLSSNLKDKLSKFIGNSLKNDLVDKVKDDIINFFDNQLKIRMESFTWDGRKNSLTFLDHKSKMESLGFIIDIDSKDNLIVIDANKNKTISPIGTQICYTYTYFA